MRKNKNSYTLSIKEYEDLLAKVNQVEELEKKLKETEDTLYQIENDFVSYIDSEDGQPITVEAIEWVRNLVTIYFTKDLNELCLNTFWRDIQFIKDIMHELDNRALKDITDSYQFNIWFNEWVKQTMTQMTNEMEKMFAQDSQEIESIKKELWSIPLPKEDV